MVTRSRLKLFDLLTVSLTRQSKAYGASPLLKFLGRSEMKIMIKSKAAAWEFTAFQFDTNASLISPVKVSKPHLPSSSPRALPNTPLNVKLVLEEI